jgi:hypothetical protein
MKVILPSLSKRIIVSFRLLMIESKGTISFAVIGVHELYHTRRAFFNGVPSAGSGAAAMRRTTPGPGEVPRRKKLFSFNYQDIYCVVALTLMREN